jgi:putative ABC transport system permease protein
LGQRTRAKPCSGRRVPLQIGDTLELNDHRAVVVGICRVTRSFQSQPSVYTTYSRATTFAPRERKLLSFILAKAKPGANLPAVCERIHATIGLAAYSTCREDDSAGGLFSTKSDTQKDD